jgi:hypothetical protein
MPDTTTKSAAIREFFSTPDRPVTVAEQRDFLKADPAGYRWVAEEAAKALGKELEKR